MSNLIRECKQDGLIHSPLGKNTYYVSQYQPELLFAIPRKLKRIEINVPEILPFHGEDVWNAYEVSWLDPNGKPIVAVAQMRIACTSKNIVESKSFKLYLNSFNNSTFSSMQAVKTILETDITKAVEGEVRVKLITLRELAGHPIEQFVGECLDSQEIVCDTYTVKPEYLGLESAFMVEETLYSDLLKSNCLVTGQPDWGSLRIHYTGPKIDRIGLLKYIVSFREHNEFHEQCVERIFMDIKQFCLPERLTVEAKYTRRGGLDINPIRSTEDQFFSCLIRLVRQ